MFGLFTQDKEIPAIAVWLEKALRENNFEVAENDFKKSVFAHPAIVSHLRQVCRKAVREQCAKEGIKNDAKQQEMCDHVEVNFDDLLRRAVSDYLRECRTAKSALPTGIHRGLVIEFASFQS